MTPITFVLTVAFVYISRVELCNVTILKYIKFVCAHVAAYGGMDVYFHPFLTTVVDAGELSASRPPALPPRRGALVLIEQVCRWDSESVCRT